MFKFKVDTSGLDPIARAWAEGSKKAPRIIADALNASGDKGYTNLKKVAAEKEGVSKKAIHKATRVRRAFAGNRKKGALLEYELHISGSRRIAYRDQPKVRKTSRGVSVASGKIMLTHKTFKGNKKLGGHVVQRTGEFHTAKTGRYAGKKREKLKVLYGDFLSDRVVKKHVASAFTDYATKELPEDILRKITYHTKK